MKMKLPLQYASGYTLDLYCDQTYVGHGYASNYFESFFGETFGDCSKQAKKLGWTIHRSTRTATCPMCSKRKD